MGTKTIKQIENTDTIWIKINDLKLGMVVHLDIPWLWHPFAKNKFRLTSQAHIDKIKNLKLTEVKVNIKESNLLQSPRDTTNTPVKSDTKKTIDDSSTIPNPNAKAELKAREKRLIVKKIALQRSKKTYQKAINIVDDIFTVVDQNSDHCLEKSNNFIDIINDSIARDSESLVHFLNLEQKKKIIHFHSLNVCIISLLMGKIANLSEQDMQILGIGALFHDVGIKNVPMRIYLKKGELTKGEQDIFQQHCEWGMQIVSKIPNFPAKAIDTVHYHHERMDGSGFPDGLTDSDICFLTQIVAVADCYENLTHPSNNQPGMLPHYALSHMYKTMKNLFPRTLIEVLIKSLGVYPPGSLVELSDGRIGLVIGVNHNSTMKPTVVVFNRHIPKQEPEIVDLYEETNVFISKALRISEISKEVQNYLEPGRRAGYSFHSSKIENGGITLWSSTTSS